ncbi:MAG: hypothetical protein ACLFRT_12730 [Actinomycetota bacterium]
MAQRYGQKPRPRVLVAADDSELGEELAERLRVELGLQTVGLIEDDTYLPEWDCVVSMADRYFEDSNHLRVISFGATRFGPVASSDSLALTGRRSAATTADELEIPEELDPRIRRLVQSDLRPDFQKLERKPHLFPATAAKQPFLTAGVRNEFLLAGVFVIPSGPDLWVLPKWADEIAWIRLALNIWSEQDPERFPPTPEWWHSPEWQTKAERDAECRLQEKRQAAEAEINRLVNEVQVAETELIELQDRADTRERVLLRGQGDDLVAVVAETFEKLSFEVINMDGVYPEGSRREDLQVRNPDDPDFVALVEVRGYKGGAQANDLMRLMKFSGMYTEDETQPPSALWYVVNHFLEAPPDQRPKALEANDDEVASFANHWKGLVIDTCDLFRLLDRHQSGSLTADEARNQLMLSTGKFELSPSARTMEPEGNSTSQTPGGGSQ